MNLKPQYYKSQFGRLYFVCPLCQANGETFQISKTVGKSARDFQTECQQHLDTCHPNKITKLEKPNAKLK